MMLELVRLMFESNANAQKEILRAVERQTTNQPNPMEMLRELLPLLLQGKGSSTRDLLQGVHLAKELLRSVGHAPAPARSGGDDLSELAGMVKLLMSAKSGASSNAPAPAPEAPAPPQSMPGWPPAGWAPPGWPPPGWPPYAMGGPPWPWYGPPGYYPGMPPQGPYAEPVHPHAPPPAPPVSAPPRAPVAPTPGPVADVAPPAPVAPAPVPVAPVAPAPVAPAPPPASSAAALPGAQPIEAPPVAVAVQRPAVTSTPVRAAHAYTPPPPPRPVATTYATPVAWTSPEPENGFAPDEELVIVEDVPAIDHEGALGKILDALQKPPHAGAAPSPLASALGDEGFRSLVSSLLPEEAKQGFYMLLAQQVGGGG
ncbi:hypothetical protein [Polyangium sp. 6x1]|uniref:hypothetical protein n=1 Tax=Polyangium sp. 6x1 TaxID=3042689 RepID=UPI0024821227|nr:hypothetical protein [Polyangium sp. 6x1]MDI1445936.1 hypothetical protein [Polyangium sp. 6x1]